MFFECFLNLPELVFEPKVNNYSRNKSSSQYFLNQLHTIFLLVANKVMHQMRKYTVGRGSEM